MCSNHSSQNYKKKSAFFTNSARCPAAVYVSGLICQFIVFLIVLQNKTKKLFFKANLNIWVDLEVANCLIETHNVVQMSSRVFTESGCTLIHTANTHTKNPLQCNITSLSKITWSFKATNSELVWS